MTRVFPLLLFFSLSSSCGLWASPGDSGDKKEPFPGPFKAPKHLPVFEIDDDEESSGDEFSSDEEPPDEERLRQRYHDSCLIL